MSGNQAPRGWPLRVFRVDGESMRPTLSPGEWLLALRDRGEPRRDQIRVFRDPTKSTRWLVKRVGDVHPSSHGSIFEARSDNPGARYAADSHDFGPVRAAGSYRVVWRVSGRQGR
jgi:phage repressor protein C with HTH and peptisase S24 domain